MSAIPTCEPNPAAKRDVRDQMVDALRRELMGPWHPEDETDPSEEFPTARYIVGRLAPQDSEVDDVENDALPTGDDDIDLIGALPGSLGGDVTLRVIDTDRTPGNGLADGVGEAVAVPHHEVLHRVLRVQGRRRRRRLRSRCTADQIRRSVSGSASMSVLRRLPTARSISRDRS